MSGTDRWREVDALFRDVLDRPPSERAAFLDAACTDSDLRAEVETLLRAQAAAGSFLETPLEAVATVPWRELLSGAGEASTAGHRRGSGDDRSGERIGAYRLLRRLGRGGMATVYLAERADGLWQQRVALKLIRRGLDTEDVIRRFRAERQILSSLGHPNIARLLDGGTTEAGLPYLVLEYVEGTPITTYCDERRFPLDERLRLFCDVARAVQHAHRSLVVHRDLKPSNILVDHDGRVKLLDFGIAKILDPADEGARTRTGLRPLTPEYASPEQVAGEPITTASDVYQLGILLGELLCGRRPYEVGRLSPARREAFLERMRPRRPSSLVGPEAADRRGAAGPALERRLRGDLDTIVLKALRKEPEQRYPSAEAMVADVESHVAGLPIAARPATLVYRARKLARRQPWLLPTAAAALIAVGGYVFTLTRYAGQLQRERNVARAEAQRAEEVQAFLVDVFRAADPYAPARPEQGRNITVREALEVGVDRVRTELAGRPRLQGALLSAVAEVYANLDLPETARALAEEALELQGRAHGPRSAETARGLRKLGRILALEGEVDSAQAVLLRGLALARAVHGPGDTAVGGVLTDLGDLARRRGDLGEAERRFIAAVELLRDVQPPPAAHLAAAYAQLLDVYPMNHRLEEARAAGEEAARLSRSAWGPDHPRTALALMELADLHDWEGRPQQAIPLYREATRILDATLGPEHERTLQVRNNLAVSLRHTGDLAGAEAVHRRILDTWRRKHDEPNVSVADAHQNLGVVLRERGELADAEKHLLEARRIYDAVLGPAHYKRAFPRMALAAVRIQRGDPAAAERSAREASAILESAFPEANYVTAVADCRLGRALAAGGRPAAARSLLEAGVGTLERTEQPSSRYEIECRRALAEVYVGLGLTDLAEPQRRRIRRLEDAGARSGSAEASRG